VSATTAAPWEAAESRWERQIGFHSPSHPTGTGVATLPYIPCAFGRLPIGVNQIQREYLAPVIIAAAASTAIVAAKIALAVRVPHTVEMIPTPMIGSELPTKPPTK